MKKILKYLWNKKATITKGLIKWSLAIVAYLALAYFMAVHFKLLDTVNENTSRPSGLANAPVSSASDRR
jgi:hypothetical protein